MVTPRPATHYPLTSAWVRREAGRRDTGESTGFVVVRRVAGDADRADDRLIVASDQHPAGHRDHRATDHMRDSRDEMGPLLRTLAQGAGADTHRQRAMRLADR